MAENLTSVQAGSRIRKAREPFSYETLGETGSGIKKKKRSRAPKVKPLPLPWSESESDTEPPTTEELWASPDVCALETYEKRVGPIGGKKDDTWLVIQAVGLPVVHAQEYWYDACTTLHVLESFKLEEDAVNAAKAVRDGDPRFLELGLEVRKSRAPPYVVEASDATITITVCTVEEYHKNVRKSAMAYSRKLQRPPAPGSSPSRPRSCKSLCKRP